jgi:uncharacterized damage-inducible protein DinB
MTIMVSPERSLAYERWANRRLLTHLQQGAEPPARAVELLAHLLSAITVWLLRLRGEDSSSVRLWSASSLDTCEAMLTGVDAGISAFLRPLDERDLEQTISYTNQHGLAYTTSVRDILFHLAAHGAYHRGQISLVLRESGLEPVNTDYITFVRELAGQAWKP